METNKKCVILSQKDYDDLVNSQNKIVIESRNMYYAKIEKLSINFNISNMQIIGNLRKRLTSIEKHLQERITEFWKMHKELYLKDEKEMHFNLEKSKEAGYHKACKEIANMSYWERRKFLKQWKQE